MAWTVKNKSDNNIRDLDNEVSREYDRVKSEGIPIIQSEPGDRPFEPISAQPVKSPGIYEAEFLVKGPDVIFHFWPWGYHEADDLNRVLPRFPKIFPSVLKEKMTSALSPSTVEISEDKDMGAWFVKAKGLADRPFHRDLSIKACEEVHSGMGGKP